MSPRSAARTGLGAALLLVALTACTNNTAAGGDKRTVTVSSTATACDVSADTAPSGTMVFQVTNAGDQVTEFYLYAKDGLRIVGEVENIGPGLTRDLVANVAPGTYQTACKPGMAGKGIRSAFTVSDSGHQYAVKGASAQLVDQANAAYAAYVRDQSSQLLDGTRRFVAAYRSGQDARARALYPLVRQHYERIEPVAESFGDLDPKMDLRQADVEHGERWTGWHRIEKDLWPPRSGYRRLSHAGRVRVAGQLLRDTTTLDTRAKTLTFTVDQIGNGAKGLLDEVAKTKITGEEEIWSHTDLYDFQANVEGADIAFEGLRPVLSRKDPALERQIAARFDSLETLLSQYRVGKDGWKPYVDLSTSQVKALSDAVNALSEPLSRLTAAVAL